jgi:hypothetical protein
VAVLRPPVALALARDERTVPAPSPLWSYEPKMDFCPRFRPVGGGAVQGVLFLAPARDVGLPVKNGSLREAGCVVV